MMGMMGRSSLQLLWGMTGAVCRRSMQISTRTTVT